MIERASNSGVEWMLLTASNLQEAIHIKTLIQSWNSSSSSSLSSSSSSSSSLSSTSNSRNNIKLYGTVGVHPTRSLFISLFIIIIYNMIYYDNINSGSELENDENYLNMLKDVINGFDQCLAIGECGLDYDRLQYIYIYMFIYIYIYIYIYYDMI